MFILLLLVTLAVAFVVSFAVARLFMGSIRSILKRIVAEELSTAWVRFIIFAIYVVGVSGGVRLRQLERYAESHSADPERIILTGERWLMEVYATIIETLQSVAWMLLLFFVFALIAYVLVRGSELKHGKRQAGETDVD
ncbi:MAG: hypothetical protein IIA50_07010 [Bacteroidetes bacterium]|nr:hypothetical protein [Bacteroidota bacterium]